MQLLGSGAILREVEAGAALLAEDFGIASDIWSVTSFMELRGDGLDADRWNMSHPTATPRRSYVETCLGRAAGPVIASRPTSYMKLLADQIRAFVPGALPRTRHPMIGRSDYRRKAAQLLRGRSLPRGRGRAESAIRRRIVPGYARCRRPPRNTASIPTSRTPLWSECLSEEFSESGPIW